MRWLIVVGVMVAHSAMASAAPASNHVPRFCQTGTNREESFAFVSSTHQFDVVNAGDRCVMLRFEPNTNATLSPPVVRLGPGDRKSVTLSVRPGIKSVSLCYAVSRAKSAFRTHANRYRAYCDGETVLCVPVEPAAHQSLQARLRSIVNDSKTLVTDEKMPATTYIYTPGPFYRKGGVFARDFLYQLEGGGRDTVTAEEVKRAVEFLALKQLKANKTVGPYTFPKGAIPDHVYPDGRYSWGPGEFHGDVNGHFNRPSMDEAFCFVTLAWHYGYKAGWDAAWRSWFKRNAQPLADAWQSVPRNPKTGLITQWTTAGHLGAAGIAETTGPCVMWGFHDSYGFPGDDLGTSVLACNAARALADMYDHVSDAASAHSMGRTADAMRDAIRAQFKPEGYLPWGIGPGAPDMASPDITGYAVWSGILTDEQADAASAWFAKCYRADKRAGGAADLFHMQVGCRGAVRMAQDR